MRLQKNAAACLMFLFVLLAGISVSGISTAHAQDKTKVMTVTVKNENGSTKNNIYLIDSEIPRFEQQQELITVYTGGTDETAGISVTDINTDIIVEDSLSYEQTVKLKTVQYRQISIQFSYRFRETERTQTVQMMLICNDSNPQVESLWISAGSKGFHPSSGNYMRVLASISGKGSAAVRMRVYNAKGRYVFQKTWKDAYRFLNYRWSGKTSKNNEAGLTAGKYLPAGQYRLEIYAYLKDGKTIIGSTKTKKFAVSSKAAAGTAGLAQAETIPVYTGITQVDYMAEDMCKKAGVSSSMSTDEKVRRIYHWMTLNFKHLKGQGDVYKQHYNFKKLKSAVSAFEKKTKKLSESGKIMIGYSYYFDVSSRMNYQNGVCSDHAVIFQILCAHAGIEAGVCSGLYLNRSGTAVGHSWNYAVVNGVTYYYDVDVEIQNLGRGQGDYYWYKKTLEQAKKNHKFSTSG